MRADDVEMAPDGGVRPPKRPWWPAALGISILVIAVLGIGFYANAHFRSPIGPVATAAATSTPATLAVAAPSPTAIPTIAPSPSQVSGPTRGSVTAVSGSPTPIVASGSTIFFHDATTPQDHAIVKAYLHYWQVLSAAELNDDPSHLDEVMADPQLSLMTKYIQSLKTDGRGLKVDVSHTSLGVHQVSTDHVQIYDAYVNASLYVDRKTKQVIPTKEPPQTMKFIYVLKKIDGTWKVVDGINVSG